MFKSSVLQSTMKIFNSGFMAQRSNVRRTERNVKVNCCSSNDASLFLFKVSQVILFIFLHFRPVVLLLISSILRVSLSSIRSSFMLMIGDLRWDYGAR